jgi:membrane fusion protein (multidrug efflux system)
MNESQPTPAAAAPAQTPRKRALTTIALAVLVVGAGYGGWYWIHGRHYESTDNAYVQANVVQITPQVSGTVIAINADDTDYVKAGTSLVKLDPADARVALDQAEAQLAQTVREVRTMYANNSTLGDQVSMKEAEVKRTQSDLARAQEDVDRRAPLVASGAVGKEEFEHSQSVLASARSANASALSVLEASRGSLASNQVMTDGTAVDQHPNVLRAAARVREAMLAVRRAEIVAPVAGNVARRSVQVGQRVQAGAPLMSVVTLDTPWVDANFKESQLGRLRMGQSATLLADVYGSKIEYHGKVVGLGAGTGSAFSLLPAQNATGNWIKIVQRVPVRIELDPKEVAAHPLRVGLSMEVTVDVADASGKVLADMTRTAAQGSVVQTAVFDAQQQAADDEVARIVAANMGRGASRAGLGGASSAASAAAHARHHHAKKAEQS